MKRSDSNEAECKAFAFVRLVEALEPRYKVKTELRIGRAPGVKGRGARLDIAVLDAESLGILLVVEVKRLEGSRAAAQGRRYGQLVQAPVIYLRGIAECMAPAGPVLAALEQARRDKLAQGGLW